MEYWGLRAIHGNTHHEGEIPFDVTVKDTHGERVTQIEKVIVGSNYSMEIEQMNQCIINKAFPHISEEFSINKMRILEKILDTVGYNDSKEQFVLPNGGMIPAVGYGSYLSTEKDGVKTILDALNVGGRRDTRNSHQIVIAIIFTLFQSGDLDGIYWFCYIQKTPESFAFVLIIKRMVAIKNILKYNFLSA